jgi:hypothetical protein
MNIFTILALISLTSLVSCAGGEGPGYLFQIVFIIIPVVLIGHYIHKKLESTNESLYVLEGQLKRVINKLEKLEQETKGSSVKSNSRSRKKKDSE